MTTMLWSSLGILRKISKISLLLLFLNVLIVKRQSNKKNWQIFQEISGKFPNKIGDPHAGKTYLEKPGKSGFYLTGKKLGILRENLE